MNPSQARRKPKTTKTDAVAKSSAKLDPEVIVAQALEKFDFFLKEKSDIYSCSRSAIMEHRDFDKLVKTVLAPLVGQRVECEKKAIAIDLIAKKVNELEQEYQTLLGRKDFILPIYHNEWFRAILRFFIKFCIYDYHTHCCLSKFFKSFKPMVLEKLIFAERELEPTAPDILTIYDVAVGFGNNTALKLFDSTFPEITSRILKLNRHGSRTLQRLLLAQTEIFYNAEINLPCILIINELIKKFRLEGKTTLSYQFVPKVLEEPIDIMGCLKILLKYLDPADINTKYNLKFHTYHVTNKGDRFFVTRQITPILMAIIFRLENDVIALLAQHGATMSNEDGNYEEEWNFVDLTIEFLYNYSFNDSKMDFENTLRRRLTDLPDHPLVKSLLLRLESAQKSDYFAVIETIRDKFKFACTVVSECQKKVLADKELRRKELFEEETKMQMIVQETDAMDHELKKAQSALAKARDISQTATDLVVSKEEAVSVLHRDMEDTRKRAKKHGADGEKLAREKKSDKTKTKEQISRLERQIAQILDTIRATQNMLARIEVAKWSDAYNRTIIEDFRAVELTFEKPLEEGKAYSYLVDIFSGHAPDDAIEKEKAKIATICSDAIELAANVVEELKRLRNEILRMQKFINEFESKVKRDVTITCESEEFKKDNEAIISFDKNRLIAINNVRELIKRTRMHRNSIFNIVYNVAMARILSNVASTRTQLNETRRLLSDAATHIEALNSRGTGTDGIVFFTSHRRNLEVELTSARKMLSELKKLDQLFFEKITADETNKLDLEDDETQVISKLTDCVKRVYSSDSHMCLVNDQIAKIEENVLYINVTIERVKERIELVKKRLIVHRHLASKQRSRLRFYPGIFAHELIRLDDKKVLDSKRVHCPAKDHLVNRMPDHLDKNKFEKGSISEPDDTTKLRQAWDDALIIIKP